MAGPSATTTVKVLARGIARDFVEFLIDHPCIAVDFEGVGAGKGDFSAFEAEEKKPRVADHFHYWNRSSIVGLKILVLKQQRSQKKSTLKGK